MRSEKQKGELAVYSSAFLWSLFPVVTVVTLTRLTPLYAASLSTLAAALFFASILTVRERWKMPLFRAGLKDMTLATLFIGIIFYGLVFLGYKFTTPGNGALVSLMEVFTTFLIVNIFWKHERFVPTHAVGGLLMMASALIILLPSRSGHWYLGDLLILLATFSAPIGNVYAQRAMKIVTGDMIMFFRSIVSGMFLLILAMMFEQPPATAHIRGSLVPLVINGVVLLGLSKLLWLEAIQRLPVAKTVAIGASEVVLTFIFAYVMLGQTVTAMQLWSLFPMFGGIYFLTKK